MEQPASEEKREKPFSFYASVVCLALLVFIVSWDATSLSVAIPAVASQFQATTIESFWTSIAFMLGVAVSQPIYVSLSDVLGRKLPLYASMVLFAVGCILFATAESISTVVAGRALQGLGGGGLDVLESIILTDMTTLSERPLWMGLMAIPVALGTILGPIIGSLFAEHVSWRWIGWVNLPFVGVAFLLAVFFLHLRPLGMDFRGKLLRIDWGGMALFTVGATSFVLPLSWADALFPWSSWRTIVPLIIGILVLAVFAWYETKPVAPMFPYRVFSTTTASMAIFGAFINGLQLYTLLFYIPLFFQAVFLDTPLESAVHLLPFCGLFVAFSLIVPMSVPVFGQYRWQIWSGWVLQTLALGLLCLMGRTPNSGAVAYVLQALLGAGIGALFMTNYVPLQAAVVTRSVDDTGVASGMLVVFRLFGGLIGLAIGSGVFNSVFASRISSLGLLSGPFSPLRDPTQAVGFIPELLGIDMDNPVLTEVVEAYRSAFEALWITLTGISGLGCVSSIFIKHYAVDNKEMGRQRLEESS
ncbi:major facilitator superfamily domain-containing protein [Stachybotrys elegans]|uniref:Major facilitator superfamily domain-containing protein n=1 Tax=Stachybotrys elegans TaxID=80388 RepID=A0A8K0WLD8_9HYPO|nr:major facilitator superfamily domain-containing protein [Stachybotrys elegans]